MKKPNYSKASKRLKLDGGLSMNEAKQGAETWLQATFPKGHYLKYTGWRGSYEFSLLNACHDSHESYLEGAS